MKELFEFKELKELEDFLQSQSETNRWREILITEFFKYAAYKNANEWNKAVRICESLAIIGWGNYEPVQAVRGKFFNGNPQTGFYNKFRQARFVSAIWSKRKAGVTMEQGRTWYHASPSLPNKPDNPDYPVAEDIQDIPLQTQRNWIPATPIVITRIISNCYESVREVAESIDKELQPRLETEMRPEIYGNAIEALIFHPSFSFYDHAHCKTNYIIAEGDRKRSNQEAWVELHKMFSKKEIEENGYFLRNRYEYGPFRNGKMNNTIHFEKALADMSKPEQRRFIAEHIEHAVRAAVGKLRKKKLDYSFDLMLSDFNSIVTEWKN